MVRKFISIPFHPVSLLPSPTKTILWHIEVHRRKTKLIEQIYSECFINTTQSYQSLFFPIASPYKHFPIFSPFLFNKPTINSYFSTLPNQTNNQLLLKFFTKQPTSQKLTLYQKSKTHPQPHNQSKSPISTNHTNITTHISRIKISDLKSA